MKKLLAIIVIVLFSFNNTEAGIYKGNKYAFKDLSSLKSIIKKNDPSVFKELKFIRKSIDKEFMASTGKPNRSNNSGKRKIYRYDAYIFNATYDSGHIIKFIVDTDYAKTLGKAKKVSLRYAKQVGQIPSFLREGSPNLLTVTREVNRGIQKIIIAKGNNRWWADLGMSQFLIYPQATGYADRTDLTLMHEAAHLTIHTKLILDDAWIEAIIADKKYITKYAITSFGEDQAETISFWVAVRCSDKSKNKKKKIIKAIPNRIKALDKFIKDNELKTFPMVCDKKL